ncbi:MAG: heavy metal translocating P-type ATPase metal-binding domain-containing protein [Aureliella sp.]
MSTSAQLSAPERVNDEGASQVMLPCVHCGEPTHCAADQDPSQVFCCSGCLGAYQLIHGWGLEDFYALREQMRLTSSPRAAAQGGRYELFDSPEFLGQSAPAISADGNCSVELAVHGLHCAACAWLIERAAENETGWFQARVKMNRHTVQLVYDPGQLKLSQIARLLDRLGYELAPFAPGENDHLRREGRRHLIRIATAGFLAANAMWIAVALYAGEFATVAADHRYFMTLVGTALGISAVAGPGRTFLLGGWAAIRTRTPHMDLPIALGLGVGSVVGTINAIRGVGHVYFDSLAVLVFLLLIGRWIQFRQQQRASSAVELMLRITPRHCTLVSPSGPGSSSVGRQHVLVDSLVAGDVISVDPGESVAADGVVVSGVTTVDRSLLTGESVPIETRAGDEILAGVVNVSEPIQLRVTATGGESRIGRVMKSVELATTEKTPIVLLADRIGGYFVMAVLALSVVTFALWARTDLAAAASHATSLLVVACPCALALATPLAVAVGLGRAARHGILVRDGQALQKLASTGRVWLDKTGTLTEGKQRVTQFFGDPEALRLAAALEQSFRHPVADAIVREATRRGLKAGGRASQCVSVGNGVSGKVDGRSVAVGNQVFSGIAAEGGDWADLDESMTANGDSPVYIVVDGIVRALLGVSDPLRKDAPEVVAQLKRMGWQVGVLSGDHPRIVRRVAQAAGIEPSQAHGGMTPEAKLGAIRTSKLVKPNQQVVMIGDGANDAAALARADVGIAVRGGAEVSLQAAPVFVATGRLSSIVSLVVGSRRTSRLIYATFGVSLLYNLVAVALALGGWISPFLAAILMPASSVSVLAITIAARTFPSDMAAGDSLIHENTREPR